MLKSRILIFLALLAVSSSMTVLAQDNTIISSASADHVYVSDIFAIKGRPKNLDSSRQVTLLINHGYMVGFSVDRKQPLWAAYRVSDATRDTHYERPHFFYKDSRLPASAQVELDAFSGFHRGHMVPNFAINTQYGKLAQMETFLMSNICPQKGDLNTGVWQRLEHLIVEEYAPAWDHIWVIAGPTFEADLGKVNGVDIPSHFYMILVDVFGRFFDLKMDVIAFKFPQNTPKDAQLSEQFLVSVHHLEQVTKLNFFPSLTANEEQELEVNKADGIWEVEPT